MNRKFSASFITVITVLFLVFSITSLVYACGGPPGGGPPSPPDPNKGSGPDGGTEPKKPNKDPKKGDPVSLVSGEFICSDTVFTIPGRVMDVAIKLSYISGMRKATVVNLEDGGSYDPYGYITYYEWDFPPDAYDITGQGTTNVSCKFIVPGTYIIKERVRNNWYQWSPWTETEVTIGIDSYSCRFGYGWDMNYNIKVLDLQDPNYPNTYFLFDGEGYRLAFVRDGQTNKYKPAAGFYDILIKNANNTFTLRKKHGVRWEFDTDGCITAITDRNGNSITFTYCDGCCDGQSPSFKPLGCITDDLGREIQFGYHWWEGGTLGYIIDVSGRLWGHGYSTGYGGNLDYTDSLFTTGTAWHEEVQHFKKFYNYDGKHNLYRIADSNGYDSREYLTNTYDANKVTEQTYGYGDFTFEYEPENNRTTVTDRRGVESLTVYSNNRTALSETIYTKGWRTGDPASYTTYYRYNDANEMTWQIYPDGKCVYYTYDPNGNVTGIYQKTSTSDPNSASDPNVIATTYEYDPKFEFVTEKTDPMDNVTTYDYNSVNGNLEKITYPTVSTPDGNKTPVVTFTYNSYGQVLTAKDPNGMIIGFEYYSDPCDPNNYGHLKKVIADSNAVGLNIATEYKYDRLGRVIEVKDPNGDSTKYTYDNYDQLTKVTAPSPYEYVTKLAYAAPKRVSQLEREVPDANQIYSLTYDILDEIKMVTDPCSYITKVGYDKSENLSDVNDAENNKTTYDYDERDLLWKVTDANGGVTEYFYTLNGKLSKIKDAKGNQTTYEYDGFDRLKKIIYPYGKYEQFEYDKNSNVTSHTSRKGDTISYEYDALNRLITKTRPNEPNTVYRYDVAGTFDRLSAGRLYDVNDGRDTDEGGGVTRYYYDRISRVSQTTDPRLKTVRYEYNNKGLRSRLVYPDNTSIYYYYDALGRLVKITGSGGTIVE